MSARKRKGKNSNLNCYRHKTTPAITTCIECDRRICPHCTTSNSYPHICPSCYSKEYDKIKKTSRRRRKKNILKIGFAVVIILLLFIGYPTLDWALDKAFEEDPEKEKEEIPDANAFLDDADVYLYLGDDSYNPVTNKVTLSVKFYLTNHYETDCRNLYVELLILKNTTIRDEDDLTVTLIPTNTTQIYWFTDIQVYPGTYYAYFLMWKDGKVYRKVTVKFTADEDDIRNVYRQGEAALNYEDPYTPPPEPEKINKPKVIKDTITDNLEVAFIFLILMIFIEAILAGIIIAFIETSFQVGNVYATRGHLQPVKSSYQSGVEIVEPTEHITSGFTLKPREPDDSDDEDDDDGGDEDD